MIEITAENFEEEVVNSDLPVILDVWAPGCGPCRMLALVFDRLAVEFEGRVKFCKLNVYQNLSVARKYGIMSVPTLITVNGGDVVRTNAGFHGEGPVRLLVEEILRSE